MSDTAWILATICAAVLIPWALLALGALAFGLYEARRGGTDDAYWAAVREDAVNERAWNEHVLSAPGFLADPDEPTPILDRLDFELWSLEAGGES